MVKGSFGFKVGLRFVWTELKLIFFVHENHLKAGQPLDVIPWFQLSKMLHDGCSIFDRSYQSSCLWYLGIPRSKGHDLIRMSPTSEYAEQPPFLLRRIGPREM